MADGVTSYITLINGVVNGLKADTDLIALVPVAQIFYGGPEQNALLQMPSITVELESASEVDVNMPKRKELVSRFLITAYENSPDYITGLQNVQNIVEKIDDALQKKYTVDGQAIYSQVANRRFLAGEWDSVPIMACSMDYIVRTRFVRAT